MDLAGSKSAIDFYTHSPFFLAPIPLLIVNKTQQCVHEMNDKVNCAACFIRLGLTLIAGSQSSRLAIA